VDYEEENMSFNIKSLELKENYTFDVIVEDGEERFIAKLELAPERISLTIRGEINEERNYSFGWGNIDQLTCHDVNKTFILYNLKFTHGQSNVLSHYPKYNAYFETTFDVSFLIYSESSFDDSFCSIDIHSDAISKWVGNTETQEEIIDSYHRKEAIFNSPDKLQEFNISINGIGILGVAYNLSMHSSSPDFKSGINFPPSLIYQFSNEISGIKMEQEFEKTYNLLAFLFGNDFIINKVNVLNTYRKRCSLYYPSRKLWPQYGNRLIFYPLGKDIRFNTLDIPSLSLEVFNTYFSLSSIESGYWKKYIKYKRMHNIEEQFLGFFRILETLSFKKKHFLDEAILASVCSKAEPYLIKKFGDKKNVKFFVKGLSRYNESKYNTEKNIQDFYLSLPKIITAQWEFDKNSIGLICKLRNDMTHANDYYLDESEIYAKTKFIEVLLIISMCKKIGISLSDLEKVINRIDGYHLLIKEQI